MPEKLYAALLRLYPAAFREEYEREMRAAFRRRWRAEPNALRRGILLLAVFADTIVTSIEEHASMLFQDVRYSLRGLRKDRVFTAAIVTTLALGIGATTAVYSLVYTVMLRPLPFSEPDRLVRIWETNSSMNIASFSASVLNFLSWQERSRSFDAMVVTGQSPVNLTGDGEPERVDGMIVSAHFWSTVGLKPVLGRAFTADEDAQGGDQVVMLGERLWRQRYGGDLEILGRKILVNGAPQTVVGIAPQDVGFSSSVDMWAPMAPDPDQENRGNHVVTAIARLKPGVNIAQAESELNIVAEALEREYPESNKGWRTRIAPMKEWIVGSEVRTNLNVLLGAAGLLLLVACSNVASLLVTRATARERELSVRMALGASRARLLRQLATESLVLATIGGTFGLLIAAGAVEWLSTKVVNQLPRSAHLAMDWPVFLFGFAVTLAAGLLFGFAPVWLVRRRDLEMTLRQTGRGTTAGGATGVRLGLIGMQIALATVLVVGALLLVQSFARLQKVELGFQPDHLLTATISLPAIKYEEGDRGRVFFQTLLSDIQGLPGVVSAGVTSGVPLGGGFTSMPVVPVERPSGIPERGVQASWRMADADYLRTMRIPLRRGRLFEPSDAGRGIVLSEGLARTFWRDGSDPLGRAVRMGNGRVYSVVGVVADVRLAQLNAEPAGAVYFEPFYWGNLKVVVRTQGDPAGFTGYLRQAVKHLDPALPLDQVRTMERILQQNTERPYLQATLFSAFALLGILLGAVGVAGVVAYTVERRTPDLAVRLALGATPRHAMAAAGRGGLIASVGGLAVGLAGAWALGEFLSTLLYRMEPRDPATFIVVGSALLLVAGMACWLPARRAARIDPALSLRNE